MKSSKIAVIMPSRGQLFSQTLDELLNNLQGFNYQIFWSHDQPIPDCFNKPLTKALKGDYTHFWIVEEDMVLPTDTLKSLMSHNVEAIACDYPVTKYGQSSVTYDPDGQAIFTGTGCLLVTRQFLEGYKLPIFRSDIAWDVKEGEVLELTPRPATKEVYGYHDITFGLIAYLKGQPIKISEVTCGQRKLVQRGADGTNDGAHQIEEWRKLVPFSLFNLSGKYQPTSRNVRLNDGSTVLLPAERADELINKGLAKPESGGRGYLAVVNNDLTAALI